MKTMHAPVGIKDIHFEGINYSVENGQVTVPDHAPCTLYQFGFTDCPIAPAIPKATENPSKAKPTP